MVLLGRYNAQGLDKDYEMLLRCTKGNPVCIYTLAFRNYCMFYRDGICQGDITPWQNGGSYFDW